MRSSKGSIQPHGKGAWRVQVEHGRDPITGKRKRYSKVVRGSKREAERVKQELMVKAGDPAALKGGMTLGEFWEHFYLPDVDGRLRPTTVAGYESKYGNFIENSIDGLKMSELEPLTIKDWLASIDTDKKRFQAFKLLRQILSKAVRWDLLQSNPCDRVEPPHNAQDYEPDVLTAEETSIYMDTFRGSNVEAVVLLCLGCGLRRSEAAALDWEDIQDGEVAVTHAITAVNGKPWDDDPKSRFSNRSVAIPASILARLEELRGTGAIVKDGNGNRMNPDNISKEYRRWQKKLPDGVKQIPLKNLRHTSLSLSIEAGVDILAVSRRAGHSNVGITSRYYLRPSKSIDSAAADSLDKLLGESEKTP